MEPGTFQAQSIQQFILIEESSQIPFGFQGST